jgi:4-amino-4-deoxy-L-arabinose transferase-like glycosyltransferase
MSDSLSKYVAPVRRWEWGALALILLVAAILRMGAPGITEFKRDEGNLAQLALDMAHGRNLPLLGLSSSVNVPNPPISVYLFAVPFVFSDSPIPATLFVGALNVIAVGLAGALARRYYGPVAAITAAVLYAVSPWAVIYSRKIWAQDLLPPFVVATVFTGLLGYGEGKRWARWAHWPLLAITVQIHYGAFTLIPLSLLMVALWPQHVRRRELLIGLGIAALTVVPAVIGAYQDGWLSLDRLRERTSENADHQRVISTTALDDAWLTVAGTDIHSLAGPEQFRRYLDSMPDAYPLFDLVPLAAVITAAGLAVRAIRRRDAQSSPDVVLFAWLVVPMIAFTWEWTHVAPHYMIPLMPAAFILCGAGLARMTSPPGLLSARKPLLAAAAGLVVVIVGMQIYLYAELLHFLDRHATPDGFGTPLHYLMDVRSAILEQHPRDVIVVSDEELAPLEEIPAVWGVLLDAVPDVRFVNGTRTAVIPAGEALELIDWLPALRTCADLTCAAEAGSRVFLRRPGEAPYILRAADTPAWASDMTALEPVRYANGALLTGYAVRDGGVILAWTLSGPADWDYQAFVHVLDADGAKLDQVDRSFWPGRYWRAGDRVVTWFEVSVPPDANVLYVGMYRIEGATYHNAEVVDAQGAYVDQAATIRLEPHP